MTNRERWLSAAALLVSILPFVLAASSLQLLPDDIILPTLLDKEPIALSKYQYLYLGIFGLVPAALVVVARLFKARKIVERNFLFMIIAALCLGGVFLFVSVYGVVYHIIIYDIDLIMQFDFYGAAVVVASLLAGMLSTYFPQLRPNDMIGLKNKYTMGNGYVWARVHAAAADVYMSVFFGFSMCSALLSVWLDSALGWIQIVFWVCAVSVLILWGRLYSRYAAKEAEKETNAAEEYIP